MKGYDIIIQAGQSNALGSGRGEAEPWEIDPDILYLEAEKEATIGDNGVEVSFYDKPFNIYPADDHDSDLGKAGDFSLTFSKAYKEDGKLDANRKLLIVRGAVGCTGFVQGAWVENGILYKKLLEMIDFALALKGDNRLIACLWHQGEEDVARECTAEDYERYLGFFIDSIRTRYNAPQLPFIAGEFVSDWAKTQPRADTIKRATKNVLDKRQNTAYVTSENLLSNREAGVSETDNIHFCRQALREMGRRYYQAYSKIQFYK